MLETTLSPFNKTNTTSFFFFYPGLKHTIVFSVKHQSIWIMLETMFCENAYLEYLESHSDQR